ncbi:hypothetical protein P2R64_23755 [Priestia megaterium]|nr:hypothetical protein [Priestia megaterium]MCT9852317.1 hypothetical protein [Priestia megaterium]MDF1963071.1 hypothetical protein [Priestia megaterium]
MAYLFYEMEESSKNSPTSKLERNEDQWELGESYASSFKKSENTIE